jgi:hypothetical protein
MYIRCNLEDLSNNTNNNLDTVSSETVNVTSSPKSDVLSNQINIRLTDMDISIIDENIFKMEKDNPGLKVSRSEMARMLLIRGYSIKASTNG